MQLTGAFHSASCACKWARHQTSPLPDQGNPLQPAVLPAACPPSPCLPPLLLSLLAALLQELDLVRKQNDLLRASEAAFSQEAKVVRGQHWARADLVLPGPLSAVSRAGCCNLPWHYAVSAPIATSSSGGRRHMPLGT